MSYNCLTTTHPSEDSLSCLLIDHLDDTNDCAPDTDGHAEDGPGGVARLLVNAGVEPLVVVDLGHVQSLSSLGYVASDPFPNGEPETELDHIFARNLLGKTPIRVSEGGVRVVTIYLALSLTSAPA